MKKRILVIDDEELLIRTMNRLLEKTGYDVFSVKNALDAETLVEEQEVDLIISDIRMPGKNGIEVVRGLIEKMRELYGREIPFIFITGFADKKMKNEARKLRPAGYLMKPFDLKQLLEVIETSDAAPFFVSP